MSEENNIADMAKDPQIQYDPFINILLLGETGVGKSTFINSVVNYLTFPEFEIAAQENLITLISSQFTVQDKNGGYHEVEIGSSLEDDKNECVNVGMSATQDVKSYVFPIWNGALKVRLIDTPGIGDGRGIDQDDMNCERILSYIGYLHELHAICYLFKPTNSRITIYFEYCMTQIISRLEKSASRNIIFIFTSARDTDYTAGETYPILKKVVANIKARPPYVDIPLGKNVFCFDNEAFHYLTAIKQNIEFNPRTAQRNHESWTWSVEQCNNLIEYIIGDSKNPPLQPYIIKNTNAINEVRRLIIQLLHPLAEISLLISNNVFALQRHKEDLDTSSNTIDELRKKLYMPVIDLEVMELSQPVTICTSKKCTEIYKVGELNKYHYKQRCHDPCSLRNVPKEIIGSPELLHCSAINSFTKACIQCQCDFSTHMHIYYLTKTVENKVVDKNIQKNINNKKAVLENSQKLIKHISTRKNELDEEHNVIIKTCAKFAHFLENNTTPFSDSYKEYIEYLITREKSLGQLAKKAIVDHLEKTLREYQEAKRFFDELLSLQKKTGSNILITPQDIQENIQKLYTLKHNGKKIKGLCECQTESRTREHKSKEYVHKVFSLFNQGKGKKKSQNKKWSQSPPSENKELFLTGQVGSENRQYQDNSMEYPLPDESQSNSQDIPNPDIEFSAQSTKSPQSPRSVKELLLTGQVPENTQNPQYQDNSMEYPPPDESQSHSQHIPNPDIELPATHSQIDNNEEMEAARAGYESPLPANEEFFSPLQFCLHDLQGHSCKRCSYNKLQRNPQDIPGLCSKFSDNADV